MYIKRNLERVEKVKKNVLSPFGIDKSAYEINLNHIKDMDFIHLEDYLSGIERRCSFTGGNPYFFSGISAEKSLQCLENQFIIKQYETINMLNGSTSKEVGLFKNKKDTGVAYGYLYDTSLELNGGHDSKHTFILSRMYEEFFLLPKGTFSTALSGPMRWRVDEKGMFIDYWKLILKKNIPFFLKNVGKIDENNSQNWNFGDTCLINGIKI